MKNYIKILVLLFSLAGVNAAFGQDTKADKKAEKAADIKNKIDSKKYTFVADYVLPMRGSSHALTSEYDLRVRTDSVIAFLPYFGQAYFDVGYKTNEGGIKFTSTNFDYKSEQTKKGGWTINIVPKDAKYTNRLILDVSSNGYASLKVSSTNKDQISFNGYIK